MLTIDIQREKEILTLNVIGEVDASSSIELDNSLNDAVHGDATYIFIDCSELQYISSAGLGVFMSYLEDLKSQQKEMVLYGMSEKVKNIFKLLGLDNVLNIVDNESEAKAKTNAS